LGRNKREASALMTALDFPVRGLFLAGYPGAIKRLANFTEKINRLTIIIINYKLISLVMLGKYSGWGYNAKK
jgi:hypothetical protein